MDMQKKTKQDFKILFLKELHTVACEPFNFVLI